MAHVLLIEDCKEVRSALVRLLEKAGHTTAELPSASNVVRHVREVQPDVIVLDYLLGGKTGTDVVRMLKGHLVTRNIPIIAASAHPSAELQMAHEGVYVFLQKPFTAGTLLKKIQEVLCLRDEREREPVAVPTGNVT